MPFSKFDFKKYLIIRRQAQSQLNSYDAQR